MKAYGQVKGRNYRNSQPVVEPKEDAGSLLNRNPKRAPSLREQYEAQKKRGSR